jgi:hypothetical protein
MAKETPCDYGDCPFGAQGGYDCRNYCGLGVDVACDEDEFEYDEEECCGYTDEDFERAYKAHYGIEDEEKFYSSSAPWNAPGMRVSDFI